jgi:glycosyltransferase involved in cell wall biosynthesis
MHPLTTRLKEAAVLPIMSRLPLVSVLMTCYNREAFVGEAIESVLASTFNNFELVIVDDASQDSTVQVARQYAATDSRIEVHLNEKNLGDYPNRNKAASIAKGKYLVYTDSDDWMLADALAAWVDRMEESQAQFGIFHKGYSESPVLLEAKTIIRNHFFQRPLLMYGPCATIVTKDYFEKLNGFPEKYGPANDMYYNLMAASQTATLIFPFPLNDYRIHEGQEINNRYSYLFNNYLYLKDALNELDLGLTIEERKYLDAKNKRRFVTNCLPYLKSGSSRKKLVAALKTTRFSFSDFFQALYIRSVKF